MGRPDGLNSKDRFYRNVYNARLPTVGRCQTVVAVAQLVESRIVIPVVVGSSPISHPKEFR